MSDMPDEESWGFVLNLSANLIGVLIGTHLLSELD